MKNIRKLMLPILLIQYSELSIAKGLDSLSPDTAKESETGTEPNSMDSMKDEAQTIDEVKEDPKLESTIETPTALSNKLNIATSFGWVGLTKDSKNWRAAGMSDVTVTYNLPLKISKFETFASFRYAPIDVAPTLKIDDITRDYVGIVESYLLGFGANFQFNKKLTFIGQAELGMMIVHLNEVAKSTDGKAPDDNGFGINFGGGLDWAAMDKLKIGPRLNVGAGSFVSYQLSGNATFSF